MKGCENTEVIKVDLDRRVFTKCGQHMNAKGKELMEKRIAAAIKHTLKVCKKTPISMKWKEDPSKESESESEGDELQHRASKRKKKNTRSRYGDLLWT
jgi:hypothetical protein